MFLRYIKITLGGQSVKKMPLRTFLVMGQIKSFIHFGIENRNDNEIEYSLVVLQVIALENPIQLVPFKKELIDLLKREHFNTWENF